MTMKKILLTIYMSYKQKLCTIKKKGGVDRALSLYRYNKSKSMPTFSYIL